MQIDYLRKILDSASEADEWLVHLGVSNTRAVRTNLTRLADLGLPLDLIAEICDQFVATAPQLADPGMALNNLERFFGGTRNPIGTATLFQRDRESLPRLLKLMNSSQALSDQLCTDPESFDLLRMTEGCAVAREVLVEELCAEVAALDQDDEVVAALRRFKRRETLRIAYGDIIQEMPISAVTRQISSVADAIVEAALRHAINVVDKRRKSVGGVKPGTRGFVVLALGKLGGVELNYSSDIDLVFFFAPGFAARGGEHSLHEDLDRANRIGVELVRLLTANSELGFAYRVDMRLRPEGANGPLCWSTEDALAYYDTRGRTWERQAYVKARPIAGDLDLGAAILKELEPWVYQSYLSLTDIAGIKTLKRKIESAAKRDGDSRTNLKTGRGGIRDIEFVIQFLQLLNGGVTPELRTGNTLTAIVRLDAAGCLTHQERAILEDNYCYLRRLEHRLQIMFDLQTHTLPSSEGGLARLAKRMGYAGSTQADQAAALVEDYSQRTELNRKILNHLLNDAFGEDVEEEPEIDLINDPNPSEEEIQRVMSRYPFQDPQAAYRNLMSLADEKITFLSPRRCRLFLSSIAPRLLAAIGKTPDPDATLVTLSRVSESIGGKAALWELFSANHPSLNLYVTLCAACPYLSNMLTGNPGMVDELTDSLLTRRLPDLQMLEASLDELTRGAEDLQPILHSFKSANHLRVGVRDILGKDSIEATHRALSDIAEACLKKIVGSEIAHLEYKYGLPRIGAPDPDENGTVSRWHPGEAAAGEPCGFIVLALGKLGGREPNYHSDLDLVLLYEADGHTEASRHSRSGSTTNSHFFSELGQRIIQAASNFGQNGRLFEIDTRLRPTGRSGVLAMPVEGFVRYFSEGSAQQWERLALCKARVVIGSERATQVTAEAVTEVTYLLDWKPEHAEELRQMRYKLQESASSNNLKRSAGGTVDTEFVVQMLQLQHGRENPQLRVPGTLDGLRALRAAGFISEDEAEVLDSGYRLQRSIESRIRLMDSVGRHEMPTDGDDLAKLAFLLGNDDPQKLALEVKETFCEVRGVFNSVFDRAVRGG